jgi:nucleoside-diphosphate-sugar epimerase
MNIEDKTILITGSTGFIGGHLAKRLVQSNRTRIRGLVKDSSISTKRIDTLPVEKVFGDMTSIEAMHDATCKCDVVVHCAVGEPYENPLGTSNIIRAALEHGIKKFIHISSTAVFGYSPTSDKVKDGRLDYKYSKNDYLTAYSHSKMESERIAFSYYDSKKLPLVVLRLSNVFGPYSTCWTTRPINMIKQSCYTLINGGLSPSNSIYIDNVVDAIILAIKEDNAIGHALTISDENTISWKTFFSSYVKMLPTLHSLLGITQRDLKDERTRQKLEDIKRMLSNPLHISSVLPYLENESKGLDIFISLIKRAKATKSQPLSPGLLRESANPCDIAEVTHTQSKLPKIPEIWLEKTFTLPLQFPINGAMDILGFKPKISFEEGMIKTEKWLNSYKDRLALTIQTSAIPGLLVSSTPLR